jgi:two-component system, CitB family, sensor kinase
VVPDSKGGQRITAITQVLTVVGNLIDNAIDAAALAPAPREVELTLVTAETGLLIRVRDTGPGVPHDMREQIFTDGVTTKSSMTGARRGLGLALVRQIVEGLGGMASVGQDGGAVFTAVLPGCLAPADPADPADVAGRDCGGVLFQLDELPLDEFPADEFPVDDLPPDEVPGTPDRVPTSVPQPVPRPRGRS